MPLDGSAASTGTVLLRAGLLLDVIRALPAGEVELELRAAEQDVELRCGAATFDIRTLRSEDFPALPSAQDASAVTVPGGAFVDTITTVARSASRDETRPVLTGILVSASGKELRLAFDDGQLTVSAQTPDVGEAREAIPVPFSGEALEIGFNPDFLRDGLESVSATDVVLKLISPLRPGLIEAGDGTGFLYLIMPIRLNA